MSIKIKASYSCPEELEALRKILRPVIRLPGVKVKEVPPESTGSYGRMYISINDERYCQILHRIV